MEKVSSRPGGWTIILSGELEIIIPTNLEESGADNRVEIRCNGSRVFVEAHDNGPLVSAVEEVEESSL